MQDESSQQDILAKVNTSHFNPSLVVEDYQKAKVSGLLLKPKLDLKASYLLYEICSVTNPKLKCVTGKIDGLLPDTIFNAPMGEITISFQSCVIPGRALNDPCGAKKSIQFKHLVENIAPLSLALVGSADKAQQIRDKALNIQKALNEYATKNKSLATVTDSFDILVENERTMDPMILGRLLESSAFDHHLEKVRVEVSNYNADLGISVTDSNSGAGILSLGSPVIASTFFQEWKEGKDLQFTESYVQGVARFLASMGGLGLEPEETLASLVSIILSSANELSLESDQSRKILLGQLGNIETQILELENRANE